MDDENLFETFITALAQAYDPNNAYFSMRTVEVFFH